MLLPQLSGSSTQRFLVLSPGSFGAAPSNSLRYEPDQQKPGNDGQSNEQIQNLLRHCFGQ